MKCETLLLGTFAPSNTLTLILSLTLVDLIDVSFRIPVSRSTMLYR